MTQQASAIQVPLIALLAGPAAAVAAVVAEVYLGGAVSRGCSTEGPFNALQEILAKVGNLPATWLSCEGCFEHPPRAM